MTQSTKTTNSSTDSATNNYANFQGPALQQAFNAAGTALGQAQGAPKPTDFTAQFTPAMMQAFQSELGYGSNAGASPLVSASTGAATGLAGAGTNAATSGLYGLANFNPVGGTDYNINAANAYANGADVSGIVNNAMRDSRQQLNDITSPAIARNAAASGNTNSTAPQIAQGIAERGLEQNAGDLSSSLRSQLFTNGLNTAQTTANNQNQTGLAQLLGLVSGGNSVAGTGVGAGTNAVGQATGLYNIANTGAGNINAGNQAPLTNALQQYQFGTQSPFDALNAYYGIVGNKSWGSTTNANTNATETSTPSVMSDIGAGLGVAGSLFGGGGLFPGVGSAFGGLFGGGNGLLSGGIGKA